MSFPLASIVSAQRYMFSMTTPAHVKWSIGLLWGALAAGLLLQMLYADGDLQQVFRTLMGGLFMVFGLYVYLTVGISKRSRGQSRMALT